MNIKEAYRVLESAYDARRFVNICLLGQPGMGKTSIVHDLAEAKGVGCVELILSQSLPSEVSGMKMPDAETRTMRVFDSESLLQLKDGDILFLDELLHAPDAVQKAAMKLVLERKTASGRPLPDVMVVAAANPDKPAKLYLPSFRDRFVFIEVSESKMEFSQYISRKYGWDMPSTWSTTDMKSALSWNMSTCRKIEQLMQWMKASVESGAIECELDITGMADSFEKFTSRLVPAEFWMSWGGFLLNPTKSSHAMLDEFLDAHGLGQYKETSVEELMEILQGLPNWDELQEELSNVEL